MSLPLPNSLSDLSRAINEPSNPSGEPSGVGALEQAEMLEQIACEKAREEVRVLIQDREERKLYANKSFKLVCFWITGVFAVLLLQGFLSHPLTVGSDASRVSVSFNLPDGVLLAVVGGTTASVISIFIVVANYLFPKR